MSVPYADEHVVGSLMGIWFHCGLLLPFPAAIERASVVICISMSLLRFVVVTGDLLV